MPENEFEKQVKELMEELHFSPSAPVWERIKKRISEKKRRVWPILFLFMSVAILSGYFFYADTKHHSKNINKNIEAIKTPTTKNLPDKTNQEKNLKKDSAFKLQSKQLLVNERIHLSSEKNSKNKTLVVNQSSSTNKTNRAQVNKNIKDDKLVFNQSSLIKNNTKEISDVSKNSFTKTQVSELNNNINNNKIIAQSQPDSNNIIKGSIANDNASSLTEIKNESQKNNSVIKDKTPAKKIIKPGKWQPGITVMYGRSNITDKVTNLNNDKALQTNTSLNNPGTYGNYPPALKNPYNVNNAYKFGIGLQRKISKQSSLNTGLNFVHLSSKSNTALSINSSLIAVADYLQSPNSAINFYRIGSAKTYTNHFNFIEIPVTFQSSLFHKKNFSLLYDGGVSVMHLISSKALIYDNHTNNFFSNDALFRRTQFQLIAGLNFQFKIKNTGKILLGPDFNYSVSPYLKDNNYSRLHFIDYGVHASWIFNKK